MTINKLIAALLLIVLVWGWNLFGASAPISPGALAPDPPEQTPARDNTPFTHAEFTITPLADFALKARVLSSETYRFDQGAALSPLDLALGWGRMSDPAVYGKLKISQGGRWFRFRWTADAPPIPLEEIYRHASNMHMVPATQQIETLLKQAEPGDVIALRGRLIRADGKDGSHWVSSLSRSDTGNGACELVWVESFERL